MPPWLTAWTPVIFIKVHKSYFRLVYRLLLYLNSRLGSYWRLAWSAHGSQELCKLTEGENRPAATGNEGKMQRSARVVDTAARALHLCSRPQASGSTHPAEELLTTPSHSCLPRDGSSVALCRCTCRAGAGRGVHTSSRMLLGSRGELLPAGTSWSASTARGTHGAVQAVPVCSVQWGSGRAVHTFCSFVVQFHTSLGQVLQKSEEI